MKSPLKTALNNLRHAELVVDEANQNLSKSKILLTDEIRKERLKQGITIRAFALKVGITSAFLCDLELGRRFPSEKNLLKIIKGLSE